MRPPNGGHCLTGVIIYNQCFINIGGGGGGGGGGGSGGLYSEWPELY